MANIVRLFVASDNMSNTSLSNSGQTLVKKTSTKKLKKWVVSKTTH